MRIKLDFISPCRSLSWHLFAINLHDPQFYFRRKVRMRETESQILWLLRLFPWTSLKVVWVVEYIAVFHKIHRVLGSCGFQWCVFHSFSKNSLNIQLMWFSLHKWRNSFTHAFWVTNDLSAADLVPADFCQT